MHNTIQQLEARVADLIQLSEGLRRDNDRLRRDRQLLRAQFDALREKNKIARGRVEQIVARLKSLEP